VKTPTRNLNAAHVFAKYGAIAVLLLLVIVMSLATGNFLTVSNLPPE
jgi:predicted ABC-type sugar transport system permease subunit